MPSAAVVMDVLSGDVLNHTDEKEEPELVAMARALDVEFSRACQQCGATNFFVQFTEETGHAEFGTVQAVRVMTTTGKELARSETVRTHDGDWSPPKTTFDHVIVALVKWGEAAGNSVVDAWSK